MFGDADLGCATVVLGLPFAGVEELLPSSKALELSDRSSFVTFRDSTCTGEGPFTGSLGVGEGPFTGSLGVGEGPPTGPSDGEEGLPTGPSDGEEGSPTGPADGGEGPPTGPAGVDDVSVIDSTWEGPPTMF